MAAETTWDQAGAEKQRSDAEANVEADVIRIARSLVERLPRATYDGGVVTVPATLARALKSAIERFDAARGAP